MTEVDLLTAEVEGKRNALKQIVKSFSQKGKHIQDGKGTLSRDYLLVDPVDFEAYYEEITSEAIPFTERFLERMAGKGGLWGSEMEVIEAQLEDFSREVCRPFVGRHKLEDFLPQKPELLFSSWEEEASPLLWESHLVASEPPAYTMLLVCPSSVGAIARIGQERGAKTVHSHERDRIRLIRVVQGLTPGAIMSRKLLPGVKSKNPCRKGYGVSHAATTLYLGCMLGWSGSSSASSRRSRSKMRQSRRSCSRSKWLILTPCQCWPALQRAANTSLRQLLQTLPCTCLGEKTEE